MLTGLDGAQNNGGPAGFHLGKRLLPPMLDECLADLEQPDAVSRSARGAGRRTAELCPRRRPIAPDTAPNSTPAGFARRRQGLIAGLQARTSRRPG